MPWNESSYSNAELDETLTKVEGTLDIDKRRDLMGRIEEIMHEDGPIAQPLWTNNFTFYDKKVQGVVVHPTNYFFADRFALGT